MLRNGQDTLMILRDFASLWIYWSARNEHKTIPPLYQRDSNKIHIISRPHCQTLVEEACFDGANGAEVEPASRPIASVDLDENS